MQSWQVGTGSNSPCSTPPGDSPRPARLIPPRAGGGAPEGLRHQGSLPGAGLRLLPCVQRPGLRFPAQIQPLDPAIAAAASAADTPTLGTVRFLATPGPGSRQRSSRGSASSPLLLRSAVSARERDAPSRTRLKRCRSVRIRSVTELLQKAFEEASKLPEQDQNVVASWLLAEMESERHWDEAFSSSPDLLGELAGEALSEHRAGLTQDLDPDRL